MAAGSGEESIWPHLAANVLPGVLRQTLGLMAGVAVLTLTVGTGTAWLVTMYRFPGSKQLAWLLLLPLAVPSYIIAFCYLELFDYTGLVQVYLREAFGWQSARDYWFPNISTLGGAIFLLSAVLYPYVYLTARASFLQQSVSLLEASRTLGAGPSETFWRIGLPLARPALAAGVALALMETLNDIGAVEFLGVKTLTVAVYDTWLSRNSLSGAAQIACVMLGFVLVLVALERSSRGRRRFHQLGGKDMRPPAVTLTGWRGWAATTACILPIVIGFALPALVLLRSALTYLPRATEEAFLSAAWNSLSLAIIAAVLALVFALVLAYARRMTQSRLVRAVSLVPSIGYAVPGTVLALGLLVPLAFLDDGLLRLRETLTGNGGLPLLTGTAFAIVLAYSIRFLAASFGATEAGFSRISSNMDAASRTLGASPSQTLRRIHLPLLRPALGAAALLVFVDSMKELPATLLLRPFNFETLATEVFTLAELYRYEEAGLSALAIVLVSLLPVLLLHRALGADSRHAALRGGLAPTRPVRAGLSSPAYPSR
ncbi:iron ABC transporter permease [Methyloligella sp. 2.7D]|uniref:ABC transporter permease n=1 Tax=unclassified Methyloligella TaxID=2625955 RepID=UPI00157D5925|nr:iron ABC transporter permease [Methyloligella sp. GL2]QKP78385.1 iron ABC transporter permease [Methyloligella sp. GL2]